MRRVGNFAEERSKYVNWVNKVLESHRGLNISEFRVRFDLDDSHESNITNWIYKVMSKNLQKFELNLPQGLYGKPSRERYKFPQECCNSLKNFCGLSSIKSLIWVCFVGVNITGELLEFFIHNCPLDRLCVAWSFNLSSLKVVGAISACSDMEEVVISAPSLLSFEYIGPEIKLHVENVLRLVDVAVSGVTIVRERHVIVPIVRCLPQLKNLELGFYLDEVYMHFSQCELPKLRNLTLNVSPRNCENLLLLAHIMKACPLLEKLILKLKNFFGDVREMHRIPNYPIQHLKALELDGFIGCATDLQVASYLIENAIMLEKVIVSSPLHLSIVSARKCPKLLEPMLPQGVELVTGQFCSNESFLISTKTHYFLTHAIIQV